MTIKEHKGFYTGQGPGAFIIETHGFAELDKALKLLPGKMRDKCLDNALKAGGNQIIPAIKRNIRSVEGGLSRSISMRVNKKLGMIHQVQIGAFLKTARIKTKSGFKMVKPFYAHMVEWGTKSHGAKVSKFMQTMDMPGEKKWKWMKFKPWNRGTWVTAKVIKGAPAQRPFTRAFDEKKQEFLDAFGAYVRMYISKHFREIAPNITKESGLNMMSAINPTIEA